jgi:hypothetical protein
LANAANAFSAALKMKIIAQKERAFSEARSVFCCSGREEKPERLVSTM